MAIWDGLKALFWIVVGLAMILLLPFIATIVVGLMVIVLAVALIIGYVAYRKEERIYEKAAKDRAKAVKAASG